MNETTYRQTTIETYKKQVSELDNRYLGRIIRQQKTDKRITQQPIGNDGIKQRKQAFARIIRQQTPDNVKKRQVIHTYIRQQVYT